MLHHERSTLLFRTFTGKKACERSGFRTLLLLVSLVSLLMRTRLTRFIAMTVPFTAVQFTTYEWAKKVLNPSNEYSPVTHMISGGLAGALGAAVTNPLDVCKTLLQTRGSSDDPIIRKANGMRDAARIISSREGTKGFFRGITPRLVILLKVAIVLNYH